MPCKLIIKFTPQLAEQLPADVVYNIMQYACPRSSPTAKLIKGLTKQPSPLLFILNYSLHKWWQAEWVALEWSGGDDDYTQARDAFKFRMVGGYTPHATGGVFGEIDDAIDYYEQSGY